MQRAHAVLAALAGAKPCSGHRQVRNATTKWVIALERCPNRALHPSGLCREHIAARAVDRIYVG